MIARPHPDCPATACLHAASVGGATALSRRRRPPCDDCLAGKAGPSIVVAGCDCESLGGRCACAEALRLARAAKLVILHGACADALAGALRILDRGAHIVRAADAEDARRIARLLAVRGDWVVFMRGCDASPAVSEPSADEPAIALAS